MVTCRGLRPKQNIRCDGEALVPLLLCLIMLTSAQQLSLLSEQQDTVYYYVGCFVERTDLLQGSVYAETPQICIKICEYKSFSYAVLSSNRCFCSKNTLKQERQPEQMCNTRCQVNSAQYCGGIGVHSYYSTTSLQAQPAPNNLHVSNNSENSLTVEWDSYEPRKLYIAGAEVMPPPQITNFLIKTQVVRTYSSLPAFPQPEFIVQGSETHFEITDLQPATTYNISVKAKCAEHQCGSATLEGTTVVGTPSPVPPQPRILMRTDTTITIEIQPIKNDNGPITKILIIVERIDDTLSQPFDTQLLSSWDKAQADGLPYYIAAELSYDHIEDNKTRSFIVGDGKRYGRYKNMPIDYQPDRQKLHVHISLGVVSTLNGITKIVYARSTHSQHPNSFDEFTYASFDKGRQSVIALTITCIIFGTCLIFSLITYIYLRYKTYQQRAGRRNAHELTLQQPIIERENNGFVIEDELPPTLNNFKQQLGALVEHLDTMKRLPRNALRLNINDIIADGRYGEVLTGKLVSNTSSTDFFDCQLHVLSLDELSSSDQAHLLREFRNLTQLRRHDYILNFYGISASTDWFYFVFEHQHVTLKRHLIESRREPNTAPLQRICNLTEELLLQWIYELATAMDYLGNCNVLCRQLCSHNIYVTKESKVKLSVFGPIHYISNKKQVDLSRWLAPEVLRYQRYSVKSDIWAFACVAWECCALGGTPYANITHSQQLLDAIKSGIRPIQPLYVYQDLYQLMLNCWQLEPSERTTFKDITYNVLQLMTSARHALSFDCAPNTPGNNVLGTLPIYMPMLETIN